MANDPVQAHNVGLVTNGVKYAVITAIALAAPVVMYFEGLPKKDGDLNPAYYDNLPSVALITACYGHTDPKLKITDKFTDAECTELLYQDLEEANNGVDACISAPLSDNERAALISFTYNVGRGKLCSSTLARKANRGEAFCAELSKWVYAGGKVRKGLVNRRSAERQLCEKP